jgi:hypothetical protein
LAQKWKAKVVDILHQVEGRRTSKTPQGPRAMTWRIVPDDFLEMTARLSKLSPEEAAWLAPWQSIRVKPGETGETQHFLPKIVMKLVLHCHSHLLSHF